MAALRLLTRTKLSAIILRSSGDYKSLSKVSPVVTQVHKRWSSFRSSPIYNDTSQYTDYEISKNPQEWEYVERLLKPKIIPAPCLDKKEYPSGWKPPVCKPNSYPYYIQRTKNYMLPVYLDISHRGLRRVTFIRRIQGDIWTLVSELKIHLENNVNKPIGIRVNELSGEIRLRGDYVNLVKEWLFQKGY